MADTSSIDLLRQLSAVVEILVVAFSGALIIAVSPPVVSMAVYVVSSATIAGILNQVSDLDYVVDAAATAHAGI
jgi:hypothetical protein